MESLVNKKYKTCCLLGQVHLLLMEIMIKMMIKLNKKWINYFNIGNSKVMVNVNIEENIKKKVKIEYYHFFFLLSLYSFFTKE
jgi:hypothetical protein